VSRLVLSVLLLALIYVLTLASLAPWDVLGGVLIAAMLLALFRKVTVGHRPAPLPDLPARLVAFIPFAARVVVEVVRGTWNVALVMIHLRPLGRPGIVAIPIEERSHRGIAVTALVTTISPGSYFLGVDWEHEWMMFHFLDASDPETIRAELARFYHRYQRHVFP
jgi:multisubunit Na+/H+ antiporter MnhE subunit